jgi:hypothetical protein
MTKGVVLFERFIAVTSGRVQQRHRVIVIGQDVMELGAA